MGCMQQNRCAGSSLLANFESCCLPPLSAPRLVASITFTNSGTLRRHGGSACCFCLVRSILAHPITSARMPSGSWDASDVTLGLSMPCRPAAACTCVWSAAVTSGHTTLRLAGHVLPASGKRPCLHDDAGGLTWGSVQSALSADCSQPHPHAPAE